MVFSYSSIVNCISWIDCCKNGRSERGSIGDQRLLAPKKTRLFLRLTRHHRSVDLKAARLSNHFMEAEDLIQHVRVGQEGVGDNAELSAAVEMTNGAADQIGRAHV